MYEESGGAESMLWSSGSVQPCAVCQSPDSAELLYHTPGFDVLICRRCNLAYVNEFVETPKKGKGIPELLEKTYLQAERFLLHRFERSLREIEELAPRGKILDIGCGAGFFLRRAKEHGWEPWGIDLDGCRVAQARKHGINVLWETFEKANYEEEQFDVVTMFNIIEHLTNPVAALNKVHRILKDGGLLVVETPTNDFTPMRLVDLVYRISKGRIYFPVKYFYTSPTGGGWGHCYRYSRKTITTILEKTQFKIIKIQAGENPSFRLHLSMRNYYRKPSAKAINFVVLGSIFAFLKVTRMHGQMVAYARKWGKQQ